jgi:hypothetical protein
MTSPAIRPISGCASSNAASRNWRPKAALNAIL